MLSDLPVTVPIERASTARVGRFEQLPKWLNLIPMVAQWVWLGILHRSITLPSTVNPGITSGGMVGDGKLEYFACMGTTARSATADYIAVVNDSRSSATGVTQRMMEARLRFPIVAKPDLGWCGYGVRLLANVDDLADYLRRFPPDETFLLQRYLADPGEAGLFYVREPAALNGRLIGILLRHYPNVVGNGDDCIADLIARDPRLQRATGNALHQCRYDPQCVPPDGEIVRLSTVASTRVGGLYEDGSVLVTAALEARVDAIAKDMGLFLVGRFDVRYRTVEDLQRGEFTIMEVNGAGSEAVHAWDPKYSVRDVYRIVFAKQRLLFRIGDANRRRGHRPIGWLKLARLHLHQQRLMRTYPPSN
ncbi:MAG: hypothetical protein ABIR62_03920 [Dokdonella sp.]|uniref:hypothetical protein n=1 Tax=Dokdonella sp. TaxID=2291710 RepID=UPI00326466E2